MRKSLLIVALCALFLQGCALWPFGKKDQSGSEEEDAGVTEQLLYEHAQRSLLVGNYLDGIERLELLESHFPFGRYAEQAQLELIYANFMRTDFDGAIVAADRFINLHPQHPNADYAFYMKGLSSYQRDRGFFDRLLGTPEPLRDVSSARQAFIDFESFLSLYPESLYATDAQLRMIYLRNVIAEAELNVAMFYMDRDAWVSAINRARNVVENFPKSAAVPRALAIMVEANHKLELPEAADDALEILALNFPDYEGFDAEGNLVIVSRVRNRDRSFLNSLTFGLLDRPKTRSRISLEPPELDVPLPPTIDRSTSSTSTGSTH